jgi:hypothetical protein
MAPHPEIFAEVPAEGIRPSGSAIARCLLLNAIGAESSINAMSFSFVLEFHPGCKIILLTDKPLKVDVLRTVSPVSIFSSEACMPPSTQ